MSEDDRNTVPVAIRLAPKVKVQGTAVIRRPDGTIRAELVLEGEADAQSFLPTEVTNDGTDT